MAQTTLDTLTKVASAKRSLKDKAEHLAEAERRIIKDVRRLLSGLGYGLVGMGDEGASKRSSPQRRARALPKTLKCPRCDRRFSLQMHVARHMSAKHQPQKAPRRAGRPAGKKQS